MITRHREKLHTKVNGLVLENDTLDSVIMLGWLEVGEKMKAHSTCRKKERLFVLRNRTDISLGHKQISAALWLGKSIRTQQI